MTRLLRHPRPVGLAVLALAVVAAVIVPGPVRSPSLGAGGSAVASVGSPEIPLPTLDVEAAAPRPEFVLPPPRLVAWALPPGLLADATPPPAIAGDAAILIDEASGVPLFEKEAHTRLAPASLTKIMTALIALERGHLDDRVEVNIDSRRMRGSTVMGLVPGERLALEDLLYGMMLPSGNDAALAISEHIGGSTPAFVDLMNQRAAELGLTNTRFANPHGLDNASHYSSAFDLAALTRVAMQREDFRVIANTTYRVATGSVATYHLGTLNPLYGRLAGVDGVKTGYTRTARQTLVGSVTRDGHRMLVVVLRSPDRAGDGTSLLNWAFAAHAWPSPASVAASASLIPGS